MSTTAMTSVLSILLVAVAGIFPDGAQKKNKVSRTTRLRKLDFFPSGMLSPFRPSHDRYLRGWYSSHLQAMGEPLLRSPVLGEVYRFTWLRTRHHPISVRIQKTGDMQSLHAIELDGTGGYDPGKKLREVNVVLTRQQWAQAMIQIEHSRFWDLRSDETQPGLDGSQWIVEGRLGTRYHVVDRWSPETGGLRELGLHFLQVSGWKFDPSEVY